MKIYGYCRISTKKQNIDRQVRNILAAYPDANIIKEVYTGTSLARPAFDRLLKKVESNPSDVTIVFDSVSRMSRNAEDGYALYEELFSKGVELVFLKEPHINTETYKNALSSRVALTGDKVDLILEGVNKYLLELAKEQIRLAFEQSQKEVDDLRQRTKEGLETARLKGKQIGQPQGKKLKIKKAAKAKTVILAHSRDFGGTLSDSECIKLCGVARGSYYKYKKELFLERAAGS